MLIFLVNHKAKKWIQKWTVTLKNPSCRRGSIFMVIAKNAETIEWIHNIKNEESTLGLRGSETNNRMKQNNPFRFSRFLDCKWLWLFLRVVILLQYSRLICARPSSTFYFMLSYDDGATLNLELELVQLDGMSIGICTYSTTCRTSRNIRKSKSPLPIFLQYIFQNAPGI